MSVAIDKTRTPQAVTEPFKRCACGRVYATRVDWECLPHVKRSENVDGSLSEQRYCPCESNVTVWLVAPMLGTELRRAARMIELMPLSFVEQYTAQELLRLMTVCWASDWDVLPDDWTGKQVARALLDGAVPQFEATPYGLHALNVDDCMCGQCRSKKRGR